MVREKVPLVVYVLWHSNFEEGYSYASEIYTNLTRDIEKPASRGIGIPVLFPCKEKEFEHRIDINIDCAEKVAIIILVDEKMLLDDEWHLYVEQLIQKYDINSNFIVYPIAMCRSAFNYPVERLKSKNFVRLFEIEEQKRKKYLMFNLTHELCRFLYNIERISEIEITQTPPPVKLFLSHAKIDGVKITKSIMKYIKLDTPLDDFFDALDIPPGYDFAKEIEKSIPGCLLLVIHTDEYSSRDWCRKEILLSKEHSIPMLVLDCLDKHEVRSFPYMSNLSTLRVEGNEEIDCEGIVSMALREVLRHKYQTLYLKFVLKSYGLNISNKNILSYPPELFSLVQTIDNREKLVIYPDPPLSTDEIALLKKYQSDLQYVTPTMLPCIDKNTHNVVERPLNGCKIGISISEISDDYANGLSILHLQDAMVEIARYLLAGCAQLYYGGDIRYRDDFNFVNILTCLVYNHNYEYEKVKQKLMNFVPYYLRKSVPECIQSDLFQVAKFRFMEALESIEYENTSDKLYSRYVKARDLSNMRVKMNEEINARIVLGGKKVGYVGIYPGILEEVVLAMNSGKPLYLIGAFGGITKEIIKCIIGEESKVITREYQSSHNGYDDFYNYYNRQAKNKGLHEIDYVYITEMLKNKGIKGLNNGLSINDNMNLFKSTNIIYIITLILKGLLCKFSKGEVNGRK